MSSQLQREVEKLAFEAGIPAPYIKHLNKEMVEKLASGYVANVYDYVLFDSIRLKADKACSTEEKVLFNNLVGANVPFFNDQTTTYVKQLRDTNMAQSNQIPNTQEIWIFSIQVFSVLLNNTLTTTGGIVTNATTDKHRPAFGNAAMIMCDGIYANKIASKTYEERPLFMYPSDYGLSGVAGGGADFLDGVANNGFGRAKQLSIGHILKGGVNFAPSIRFCNPVTPTQDMQLWFLNVGVIIEPAQ